MCVGDRPRDRLDRLARVGEQEGVGMVSRLVVASVAVLSVAACQADSTGDAALGDATDVTTADTADSSSTSAATTIETTSPATTSPELAPGGVDGPVMYASQPDPSVDSARLDDLPVGRIHVVGDCLYHISLGGGAPLLVLWPYGTRWQADPPAVLTGGLTIPVGAQIEGGDAFPFGGLRAATGSAEVVERAETCSEGMSRDVVRMYPDMRLNTAAGIDEHLALPRAGDPDPAGGVDGPVMYAARPGTGHAEAMLAELVGRVHVEGDCLSLIIEGGEPTPVLWPYGTSWQSDPPAVILSSGVVVPAGAHIHTGGGFAQPRWYTDSAEVLERASQCTDDATGDVAIIQHEVRVIEME